MKKSDWALIILIVAVVGVASFFIVNLFVKSPKDNPETVKTAEVITSDVDTPDPDIFNSNAINPTVKVKIGDQSNSQPFTIGNQ